MKIYYTISTYLLCMIAIFFALMDMMMLLVALGSPALLLPVFLLGCVVIYSFTSFKFLQKGIQSQQALNPSLKDWIKVNAYVAMAFGSLTIFQSISFFAKPQMFSEAIEQAQAMQGSQAGAMLNKAQMNSIIQYTLYFLFAYSIVLVSHILISFKYIKQYLYLFNHSNNLDQ